MKLMDFAELTFLAAIWGASFLFMRIAVPEVGPVVLMALRVVIATVCLLPFLYVSKQLSSLNGKWLHLFMVGIFSTALPFTLFGYATLYLPAGITSVLNTTTPMFGVIVGYLWFKDKISLTVLIGLSLSFAGIYLLMFDKISSQTGQHVLLPTLAILIATFCYALAANYTKHFLSDIKPMAQATGSLICASAVLVPISAFYFPEQHISNQAITSILLLGILCTGLAYVFFFRLLVNVGPINAVSVTYLIPIFGILWGNIFLHEQITALMVLGVFVILFGVSLSTGLLKRLYKTPVTLAEKNK